MTRFQSKIFRNFYFFRRSVSVKNLLKKDVKEARNNAILTQINSTARETIGFMGDGNKSYVIKIGITFAVMDIR